MVRETRWLSLGTSGTNLSTANSAAIFATLSTIELALRPFTIVRTRGVWRIITDQQIASELTETSLGACVVSDQAAAIGITAIPTPETDKESDLWFMYETTLGGFQFGTAVGFTNNYNQTTFDSKAMRKVEDGQDVAIVLENTADSAGVNVHVSGRMLIKLH